MTTSTTRSCCFYDPVTYQETEELVRVPDWDYSYNAGGGGLLSTATDLVRFGWAFVEPGFLSRDSLTLAATRQATGTDSPWGVGWMVDADCFRISGSYPGFQSGLVVYPKDRLVVSVLSNSWGKGAASGEFVSELPARIAEHAIPTISRG